MRWQACQSLALRPVLNNSLQTRLFYAPPGRERQPGALCGLGFPQNLYPFFSPLLLPSHSPPQPIPLPPTKSHQRLSQQVSLRAMRKARDTPGIQGIRQAFEYEPSTEADPPPPPRTQGRNQVSYSEGACSKHFSLCEPYDLCGNIAATWHERPGSTDEMPLTNKCHSGCCPQASTLGQRLEES